MKRSWGFTLAEALTVLLALSVLAGGAGVLGMETVRKVWPGGAAAPEKEAEKLARWLVTVMTVSNRSGRSVKFSCPSAVSQNFVEAVWQNFPYADAGTERYVSAYDCEISRYGGGAESLYEPQWAALVPAMTIEVSRGRSEYYVIVSQRGRVRTNETPPGT